MSQDANITVLVPTFNRAHFIAECLDSLLAQSVPPTQILVVNDGSTDQTRAVLEPYRHRIDYLEIENGGKSNAINAGLEQVTGDYLWIFDDDDVALPDALERLVAPLLEHPGYGFSYAPYFVTETGADGRLGEVRTTHTIPDPCDDGFLPTLLRVNFLGGASLFARTSCYGHVGGFNTQFVRSQDYEMAIRIARHFEGVRAQGGPTFHYRQHDSPRGNERNRFARHQQRTKWLEYDQTLFRYLYNQLDIEEYLPPDAQGEGAGLRLAYIKRIEVMAAKLMVNEVIEDLNILASLSDQTNLTDRERAIIHRMVLHRPYYRQGRTFDNGDVLRTIRRLAKHSKTLSQFRAQIAKSLSGRLAQQRRSHLPREARNLVSRLRRLYIAGFLESKNLPY